MNHLPQHLSTDEPRFFCTHWKHASILKPSFRIARLVNSLPKDKILDWSKQKAYADDQIKVIENLKFLLWREENIVGKGENAGYQHFLLFPQCFEKASQFGVIESQDCVVKS